MIRYILSSQRFSIAVIGCRCVPVPIFWGDAHYAEEYYVVMKVCGRSCACARLAIEKMPEVWDSASMIVDWEEL